jgi:hypothetical protein
MKAMEAAADRALEAAKASLTQWSDCVRCTILGLEMLTNFFTSDGDHDDGEEEEEEDEGSAAFRRAVHGAIVEAGVPPLVRCTLRVCVWVQ